MPAFSSSPPDSSWAAPPSTCRRRRTTGPTGATATSDGGGAPDRLVVHVTHRVLCLHDDGRGNRGGARGAGQSADEMKPVGSRNRLGFHTISPLPAAAPVMQLVSSGG